MKRQDVLLAALASGASSSKPFEPVHVQKAMFLIAENAPHLFDKESRYSFEPYDYGPFDSAVYQDLEKLQLDELVHVDKNEGYGYRCYRASESGVVLGQKHLAAMKGPERTLVEKTVALVLPLSFRQLVSAIYRTYPRMKVNSVFTD